MGKVPIGGGHPIVVQTMCNTHTNDVEGTVAQCIRMAEAGAELIRITVPGLPEVEPLREIRDRLRAAGVDTPLVADIHFSAETAIAAAAVVEKVRINPGNFHRDHGKARTLFARFIAVCKEHGTAVRVGLNHGSLGEYITNLYGNTPLAMAKAAMEWLEMCIGNDFYDVVVSLKASNTPVMVEAYRRLSQMMQERGVVFPVHVGVTEAGNGDAGRIKSCVGISTLLSEGIGDTVRVSLTDAPENEVRVGLAVLRSLGLREPGPDVTSCPTCGRTMCDLIGTARRAEDALERLYRGEPGLKRLHVAVMGCVVNGPGEARDADLALVGGPGCFYLYRRGVRGEKLAEADAVPALVEAVRR